MERKIVSGIILAIVLVVMVIPQSLEEIKPDYLHQKAGICHETVAGQNSAVVSFYAVRIGKTVEVYITVQNVAELYGFEINITWNPLELGYVSHSVRIPVETFPDGILHTGEFGPPIVIETLDVELGRYDIIAASLGCPYAGTGAPPFNGCGNVVIITFEVKVEHPYTIEFASIKLADAPEGPGDPSDPIPFVTQDGVEVTPPSSQVQLNPPIFNINRQLWMRIAPLGQIVIRSLGYAGWLEIQTGPIAQGISLFVSEPGTTVKQYDILPYETISAPIYLGLSPGEYSGEYSGKVSIRWGEKTKEVRVTLDIVSLKVCSNLVITGPGGKARFTWIISGGSQAYLEVEEDLPDGWSYSVDPPVNTVFETPYTLSLNITAAENAKEGDRGIIILKAFHADTGTLFWYFTYAAVLDNTAPIIEVLRPKYLNYSQVVDRILRIEVNVSDLTSGIETVKLFYSINDGPWINKTMNWMDGDTFNSTEYSILIPLETNETIKYYIMATDNVGHQTITQNYTYIPGDTDWLMPYDVDIFDVVIITAHYGSKIGQPNWDERADVDGDGKVDILDVVIACVNYGKKDP